MIFHMNRLRVGVVGVGHLGSIHARIYKEIPDCQLVAVCDTDRARLQEVSMRLGVEALTDYRKLFGRIDAVSIAVPTALHYELTRAFLSAGMHALVEKPFTPRLREADALIRLARRKKLLLAVGHVERFNSAFSATQKLIHDPQFIECHRLSPFPNRSLDVGVVLDVMIHDIDIVLGLVGSRLAKIESVGINVLTDREDIANARLTFSNGCVANLTASRVSDDVVRKIRIFQKDAYISLDYKEAQANIYRRDASGIGKEALPIEKEQPLEKELRSFIDCVIRGNEPLVSGSTARQALAVALKIQAQIWSQKRF